MKELIKVKILSDGIHAKEVNPLGEIPNNYSFDITRVDMLKSNEDSVDKWREAESKLRTFEIGDMDLPFGDGQDYDETDVRFAIMQLPVGSIHTAELLENGKIKIIE